MQSDFTGWIEGQKNKLEKAIANWAKCEAEKHEIFDRQQAQKDLLELGKGRDAFYDRESSGIAYALYYHPPRTNEALSMLYPVLLESEVPSKLEVIDLGCGTGATLHALAILQRFREEKRMPRISIDYHGFDISPFMLNSAQSLQRAMEASCGKSGISTSWRCETWSRVNFAPPDRCVRWVSAGFLFDHSDLDRKSEIRDDFAAIIQALGASRVFISSSNKKREILDNLAGGMAKDGWLKHNIERNPISAAPLNLLGEVRKRFFTNPKVPNWTDASGAERCSFVSNRLHPGHEAHSRDFVLSESQIKARDMPDLRVFIKGAAGTGKTQVLVDKLRTFVQAKQHQKNRVLCTTFNKALVGLIRDEFAPHARRTKSPTPSHYEFKHGEVEIEVRTFDSIVYELYDEYCSGNLKQRSRDIGTLSKLEVKKEFELIIYGYGLQTLEDYLRADRRGRKRALRESERKKIWQEISDVTPCNFTQRRRRIREYFKQKNFTNFGKYDLILVDECQHFTPSDFEILDALLLDSSRRPQLMMFGDPSQAVKTGRSFRQPQYLDWRRKNHSPPQKVRTVVLSRSYRIALRIAEAITPLAKETDGESPTPAKWSVAGFRPILICESNSECLGNSTNSFLSSIIMQDDSAMVVMFDQPASDKQQAEMNSFQEQLCDFREVKVWHSLKHTGLEADVVIWHADSTDDKDEESLNKIYVALSRAKKAVIIVTRGFEHLPETSRKAIGLIPERLINPWNQKANEVLDQIHRPIHAQSVPDDDIPF